VNAVVSSKASITGLNHITNFQSNQGGGWGINTDASWLNQGGGGGTGFRDRLDMKDGILNQLKIVDRCESSMMKTELTALCIMNNLISCDPVSCKKMCNGS